MKAEANARGPWRGLVGRACVLFGVLLLVLVPAVWLGYTSYGPPGVMAAVAAALVCCIGATSALFLTALFRGPQTGAHGILLAALFRMGLPMGYGALLMTTGGPLSQAGGVQQLLAFYLIALTTETILAVPLVRQGSPDTDRSSSTNATSPNAAIASEG